MTLSIAFDCLQAPEKTYQEKVALLLQIWKLLANYKLPEVSISLDTITQHLYVYVVFTSLALFLLSKLDCFIKHFVYFLLESGTLFD